MNGSAKEVVPAGFGMIESIEINNFRCFTKLIAKDCARINLIVGENGAGKTALLEAVSLALSGSTERGIALRQIRGSELSFANLANLRAAVEAYFSEYFTKLDLDKKPSVKLKGAGPEVRTLTISRGRGDLRIPSGAKTIEEAEILSPIIFEWIASNKKKYTAAVKVTKAGLEFEGTGETLPSNWFFYAAQVHVPSRENADRFTALRRGRAEQKFISIFKEMFDWIEDIFVDSEAGAPILSAIDRTQNIPLPLPAVSGGINRMASILLAIALQQNGIALVDEIDNGIFYTKHAEFSRALIRFSREYNCQLFLSTHSQEWLRAFVSAAGNNVEDISLWRIERASSGPTIERFDGKTFKIGIEHGAEVRLDQS